MFNHHIGLDQPAEYEIKIQGRLAADLSDWFLGACALRFETGEAPQSGASMSSAAETVTCLTGTIADQAALHGLLTYIRDLGLTLLYVDCLSARGEDEDPASPGETLSAN